MSKMQYNLRYPVSSKDLYGSGDNVDFVLNFNNNVLVGNSVKISGVLDVYKTGTTRINDDDIKYDAMTGIHGFFDNFTVSTQLNGVLENRVEYARYVTMSNNCTKDTMQTGTLSTMQTELCCTDDSLTKYNMNNSLSFSFLPSICLNNIVPVVNKDGSLGPTTLDYRTSGDVTISLRLVEAVQALYGSAMTDNVNFKISNLALEYLTAPAPATAQPCRMLITHLVKRTISSSNAIINVKLPALVSRCSASFLSQSHELTKPYNNLALERPDGIYKVSYSFNDQTNSFITYPLETTLDMLDHFINSFANNDNKNNATLENINNNKFFGVGLNFGGAISLQNNSFGINILSTVSQQTAYLMFLYFSDIVQIK